MKKIVLTCIVGIALLSFIAAKEFLFKPAANDEALGIPVAEVQSVQNEMRFKHTTSFFWADAVKSQKLFNGSQVFTGTNSEAVLEMKSKDVIRVPSETLLRITEDSKKPGSLALNLEKGELKLQSAGSGKGLSIHVGDAKVELSSKTPFGFFAKKEATGNLILSVSSGSVTVENGEQKKLLSTGQTLQLKAPVKIEAESAPKSEEKAGTEGSSSSTADKNATATPKAAAKVEMNEVENESLQLLYPPTKKVFYGQGLDFFKWKAPQVKKLVLEYSRSFDFTTNSKQLDVTDLSESVIPKDIAAGEYYWRVVAYKEDIPQYSETRTFRIDKLEASAAGEAQLIFKERGKWQLVVPVKGGKSGEQFNFQLSKRKDFADIYDGFEGPEPFKSLITESGVYSVRLRKAFGGGLYSDWSTPLEVKVRPPLEAPVLMKGGEKLDSNGQAEMNLAWEPVIYAKDYLVQIGEGPNFTKILKNVVVEKSPYELHNALSAPGYLRLIARSEEGEYSPPSQVYQVKGVVRGPSIEKKEVLPSLFEKEDSSPQFHLLWTHREASKKYRIELSRDPKLATPELLETQNVEIFHNVREEGWYYFRLWPVVDDEKYFAVPTPILAVSFGKPGPLIAPKSITPKKNEVFLTPKGVSVSIKFTWSESPENEWYVLQLAQKPSFDNPLEYKVEAQEYILKNPIPNGRWYFRVRGRNKYQASNWSEPGVFYFGVSK